MKTEREVNGEGRAPVLGARIREEGVSLLAAATAAADEKGWSAIAGRRCEGDEGDDGSADKERRTGSFRKTTLIAALGCI